MKDLEQLKNDFKEMLWFTEAEFKVENNQLIIGKELDKIFTNEEMEVLRSYYENELLREEKQ